MLELKTCIRCGWEVDKSDTYYPETLLCNNCYWSSEVSEEPTKPKKEISRQFIQQLLKEGESPDNWHCNNCWKLLKKCECGEKMLPTPIKKEIKK